MFYTKVEMEQLKSRIGLVLMSNINLKKIRTEVGYTQKELANKLGITQQQYSRYETNTNKIPLEMFLRIVYVCHLNLELKKQSKV